jgi:PPOX class probable F420-dependent enzyme
VAQLIIPESHRALAKSAGVAVLTTIGPDGYPQSTAVGYLLDGDLFRMTVASGKQKLKNLQRRPECSVFVFDPATTHRTLEIRGRAELIPDDDFAWAARIAESLGSSVEEVRRIHPPGEHRFCVTVHPVKATTFG